MSGVNKVTLLGRLSKDPEVKSTQSGNQVCNFCIVTAEKWKGKDGKDAERVEFHSCVAWGNLALIVERFTKKGMQLYVEGKLETRNWLDDAGQKHWKTEIIVSSIELLGTKLEEAKEFTPASSPQPDKFMVDAKSLDNSGWGGQSFGGFEKAGTPENRFDGYTMDSIPF